ncbi:MAG: murein biosynthesis integral membrane protein MurJ [Myxococcota bacterium]
MSTEAAVGVSRSAGVVAGATLASRVLGLLRDSAIAYALPVSASDAFFVAFTIPNLLRRLVGEGALTVAFVPVFDQSLARSHDEARRVLRATWTLALLVTSVICVLGMIWADLLVIAFAPGYVGDPAKLELTTTLLRLCFPYVVSLSLVAVAMGALNALGHFFRPAIAPVWLNVCQIASVFIGLAFFTTPVLALGFGVIVAGVLQVWLQLRPLRERGFAPKLLWAPGDPAIRRLGWILLPSLLGASAYQLNTITTRAIASFFGDGPVSYLYYATRLLELPLGVFIFALSMASLPSLARSVTAGDRPALQRSFAEVLGLSLALALPCTAGLILLREPIVALLFGWNPEHFGAEAVRLSGLALLYYTLGLVPISLSRIYVNLCVAHQNTRTGAHAAVLSLIVNVAGALVLVGPLPYGTLWDGLVDAQRACTLADFGFLGLALATSLAAAANAAYVMIAWRIGYGATLPALAWVGYLGLVVATAVLCAAVAFALWLLPTPSPASLEAVAQLAGLIALGVVAYLGGLWALAANEFALVARLVRRIASAGR